MKAIPFPQSYVRNLGAGDNPNTGDLPRCVAVDATTPTVCYSVSCWEPSEKELAAIVRDKKVYLSVMASKSAPTQPPVCVMGLNPFDEIWYTRVPEEDVKFLKDQIHPIK